MSKVIDTNSFAVVKQVKPWLTVRFALQDISVDRQNLVAYEYNIGTAMEIRIDI